MTRHFTLKLAALALPIALAACGGLSDSDGGNGNGNGSGSGSGSGGGGGSSSYTLAGTISGLNESGLVLSNGSETVTLPAGATTFTFSASVTSGAAYQVAVGTQPMWQNCSVTNGSGTVAGANVTDVAITCAQSIHLSTDAGANSYPGRGRLTDGSVYSATFGFLSGVAADGNGNRYVSDDGHGIRKLAANGVVTTIVRGGSGGLAVDAAGNVFVADPRQNGIRKIAPDGTVSTVAGTTAVFNLAIAVAVDAAGNLFVADRGGHRIAKVAPDGTVSTLAGSGTPGDANGIGTAAQFSYPSFLAIDGDTLYVVESNRVRKVMTADGTVSTLAGNGTAGSADGPGAEATFREPRGIAAHQGNVYVVDGLQLGYGDRIRRIKPDGTVSTFVPAWVQGTPCCFDGRVGFAALQRISGLAVDAAGDLLVTELGNNRPAVRRISRTEPEVRTLAYVNGNSNLADVVVDRNGNYYVSAGSAVEKVSADGTVSRFAGTGAEGNADGPGAEAQFGFATGLAIDANGNVYVADNNNHSVRKIAPDGTVSTLAGTGVAGFADGPAASAQFARPESVAVDASGNVYVSDGGNAGNCRLRKITPDGNVTTLAGGEGCTGVDGVGAAAGFGFPWGLAVDSSGNVYVADYEVGVRKVTPNGTVTTLAKPANVTFTPSDVTVDASGNVYAINEDDTLLYRIGTDAAVVHFAGTANPGVADGPRSTSRFGSYLTGLTFDSRGYVVVADRNNGTIRQVSTAPGTLPALRVAPRAAEPKATRAAGFKFKR